MSETPQLTPLQAAIIDTWETIRRLYKENHERANQLIAEGCNHPLLEDYTWEWDSGYGRQSTNVGKRCKLCGAKDPYVSGKFHYNES